jgi:hypothetical protein
MAKQLTPKARPSVSQRPKSVEENSTIKPLKRTEADELRELLYAPDAVQLSYLDVRVARRTFWNAVCLKTGSPEPFYRALQIYGPFPILRDHDTMLALHFLWEEGRTGDPQARAWARGIMRRVAESLTRTGPGRFEELTPEQRNIRRRESNVQLKRTHRALEYADRAFDTYRSGKQRLMATGAKGNRLRALLQTVAEHTADQAFSRNTPAARHAKALFWQAVLKDIADSTR